MVTLDWVNAPPNDGPSLGVGVGRGAGLVDGLAVAGGLGRQRRDDAAGDGAVGADSHRRVVRQRALIRKLVSVSE